MMNSAYDKLLYPSFRKAHFFPRHKPPTFRPPACSVNITIRVIGRSKKLGGQNNLPPFLIEIGLTDVPKYEWE